MSVVASRRMILWAAFPAPLTLLAGIYPWIIPLAANWLILICCVAGIDWMMSRGFSDMVRVSIPAHISLVQSKAKRITLVIANSSRYPLWVRIGIDATPGLFITPDEIRERVGADSELNIPMTLESPRRGTWEIEGIRVEACSTLGFFLLRRNLTLHQRIQAYPNIFLDNQRLAASLFLRRESGMRSQRIVGHGREFEQLRDYLPDDNFADIAWKATAKKGHPITKVFQMERTQHIYIALDHSRSSHLSFGNRTNLDVAIEGVLLMQLCCERMGDMLGLITFADKISRYCPAGKGRGHFGILRNLLHDLSPKLVTPDFENLFIFVKQRIRKRALVLLFTNLEDPGLASAFFNDVAIIKRSHLVTVCTFNGYEHDLLFSGYPVNGVPEIYRKLAAQLANNEQEKFSSMLKKQNVDMLRFRQNRFAAGVIEHYMGIKRRQVL